MATAVQGAIVPQEPRATEPPGTADLSRHPRAIPHEMHGGLQVNRPNLQRVLWRLVPVFRHGPRLTQVVGDTPSPLLG